MLADRKTSIGETVEARKAPLAGEQAWELLQGAGEVIVGKGRNAVVFHPATDSREEILAHCLGRTGTLRAPTLKIGKRFLVGFNDEMYSKFVK
ncbi:MAG TPA: hypothetical protein DDY20_04540 [Desulfobulbaceae bacterium]|nr:hypothetical protein [Desulfobulbaceae bacterium]